MDHRLVGWARAVKARRNSTLPPLWLFTDPDRMPSLETAIAGLPRGLCGVVFRHDRVADRADLLRRVTRQCRAQRIPLVVAGLRLHGRTNADCRAWAGRHLRAGHGPPARRHQLTTSSAHDPAEIIRARRSGADAVFLSPVFPTISHPDGRTLGPLRWAAMARQARVPVLALGGLDGQTVRRLPQWIAGVGAIGALLA